MKPAAARPIVSVCALAVALLLLGCTGGGAAGEGDSRAPTPSPSAPAETGDKVDIRGKITSLSPHPADAGGSILVEGAKEPDTSVDKASIRIGEGSKVYRRTAEGKREPITYMQLRVGQTVEALFTGPVAESYPVQAMAAEVTVTAEP